MLFVPTSNILVPHMLPQFRRGRKASSPSSGVAFDAATSSGNISNLTSTSFSHTCTGTNRYLIVGLAGWDNASSLSGVTMTYNGVALTKLGGQQANADDNAVLWGLLAPATGTNTLAISNIPTAYNELGGGAVSFSGVHQTTPLGTLVSNGTQSINLTMAAGDMGVDIIYAGDGRPTAGSGETERVACAGPGGTNPKFMMMGTEAGTGTVTMNWILPGILDSALAGTVLKAA